MNVTFFKSPADFRRWLESNHAKASELHVGFFKKSSGKAGLTYAEAVEEALCFGWIDSVARGIDENSYMQRFTPRKRGSIWSKINIGHIERLTKAGRMHPAGLAAFAARDAKKTGIYSFERDKDAVLPRADEKRFRANKTAWTFFNAQPPGYRRVMLHHVVSAKQEATRQRRLDRLIAASAAGRRIV